MKTEVYKKFKEFESKFSSAVNSSFARFSAAELESFSSVLSEHRGTPLSRQERTCPRCLLNTIKTVANEYYKFKSSPWGKKADGEDNAEGDMEAS